MRRISPSGLEDVKRSTLNGCMRLRRTEHCSGSLSMAVEFMRIVGVRIVGVRIVGEQCIRWRSIQYYGVFSSNIVAELERRAPLLDSIRITFTGHGRDMGSRLRPIRIMSGARLQRLEAHNTFFAWRTLCGLRTLRLSSTAVRSEEPHYLAGRPHSHTRASVAHSG